MKNISRDNYYIQTNNPTEVALKNYRGAELLVSCGATAMINCIAPLGCDIAIKSPTGKWDFQPEECVTDLLDPRNRAKLNAIRDLPEDISKNEVPQYYPYAASVLFGATAKFIYGHEYQDIYKAVINNSTVQLCLKNPGHYIAVVAGKDGELYYNDSWPGRHKDSNGYMVKLDELEYKDNVKNYAIWYWGEM